MNFSIDETLLSISRFEKYASEKMFFEAENEVGNILFSLLDNNTNIIHTSKSHNAGIDYIVEQDAAKIGVEVKARRGKTTLDSVAKSIVHSTINSFDRLIIISSSPFTTSLISSVKRFNPIEVQLYDIEGLKNWAFLKKKDLDKTEEKNTIELLIKQAVTKLSQKLIHIIYEKGEQALDYIEWRQLEAIVEEIFSGLGFETELTPPSKDGGKDVVIMYQGCRYLIEIKHWKAPNRVGSNELSSFLQVIVNEKSEGGLYLSTSGYCANAFEQLKVITRKPVSYQGMSKIISLVETYEKYQSGIWTKPLKVEELLFA